MDMIRIIYWQDRFNNHKANSQFTEYVGYKDFPKSDKTAAIDFLNECSEPITKLQEILTVK